MINNNRNREHIALELKSLIVAILIHLIIAYLFIFSFPVKPVADRPDFVFWGSFLAPFINNDTPIDDLQLQKVHLQTGDDPRYSFSPELMLKPAQQQPTPSEKQLLKTTFLQERPQPDQKEGHILDQTKANLKPLKPLLTIP